MATVVTVHGTFAHSGGTADALNIDPESEAQWWQHGSAFEADIKALVAGADGTPVDVVPFAWSSLNSEIDRRNAGSALLRLMRGLDAQGEPYCVVGHSHGGSVIASALIESVARKRPLTHLKRWITVGTPFVGMRKERFLFTRLTLPRRVMFVASLMLFMMFLFYVGGELFANGFRVRGERYVRALLFNGVMMTLPILVFYTVFRFLDGRELMGYGRGAVQRARDHYGDKWLPLCHKDDEAVQGLRYLPKVQYRFFDRDFATSTLTKAAVVVLPLAYLLVVTSPGIMLGISDFLQTRVYGVQEFADDDAAATQARQELRALQERMRVAREAAESGGFDAAAAEDARVDAGRVGLFGISIGGMWALKAAATDGRVKALYDLGGPINTRRFPSLPFIIKTKLCQVTGARNGAAIAEVLGKNSVEDDAVLARVGAAVRMIHGDRDRVVSVADKEWLRDRLLALGDRREVSLEVLADGDHCCTGHAAWIRRDMAAFFRRTLLPAGVGSAPP